MATGDNIEKYFKKVLKQEALSEEEWTIPSDDIWNAAKIHFPKKKKKDRAIFFWWGIGVLVLGLGTGIALFLTKDTVQSNSLVATNDKNTNKQVVQNEETRKKNITDIPLEKEETIINLDNKNNQSETSKKQIQKPRENSSTTSSPKPAYDNQIEKAGITAIPKQQKIVDSQLTKDITNNLVIPPNSTEQGSKEEELPVSKNNLSQIRKVLESPSLNNSIHLLDIANQELDIAIPTPTIVSPAPEPFPTWEVGLSYAPFILIQESILNNGVGSPFEEQTVGLKHQNINLHIRRYLSPRFSLSSGLYLSKGELDFKFCDKAIYDIRTATSLGHFLKERSATNSIKLSDLGIDIDATVAYTANANLSNGDELIVKGRIPFDIQYVQMPLFLNLHFGKRKLKGLLHAGVSLDYQHLKANALDFSLLKENQRISEPLSLDPLNEHSIKARWLAGAGIRYHITNSFQIGTDLNINISEPILSRYDFGVYYGF